jgi:hypothetical protein
MQDNSRPQVFDYMNAVDIQFMEWPSNSFDSNPIERLWDALKKKV